MKHIGWDRFRGKFSTADMVALSGMNPGEHVWNTTFLRMFWWNGSVWLSENTRQYTNVSGGSLVEGDVVIASLVTAAGANTTTTAESDTVLGPVVLGGANNEEITVAKWGRHNVLINTAAAAAEYIETATTVKTARTTTFKTTGSFGRVAATKGSGTALLLCDIGLVPELI
jgi:hypothetical protein